MLVPVDEGLIRHSKPFGLYPGDSGKPWGGRVGGITQGEGRLWSKMVKH